MLVAIISGTVILGVGTSLLIFINRKLSDRKEFDATKDLFI